MREKSSWRSVGASDGGIATTPENFASPSGRPMTVTMRMPISVPPMILRAIERRDQHEAQRGTGAPAGLLADRRASPASPGSPPRSWIPRAR